MLSESASGLARYSAHSESSSLVSATVVLDFYLHDAVLRGYCCGGWADSLPYCFLPAPDTRRIAGRYQQHHTMDRTENDICLLCLDKKATKKNSHIISKFIGKSILQSTGDSNNRAYVLDTSKPHLKPRIYQDSPKENHILCPECEKYFEVLETYIAKYLFNPILIKEFEYQFEYKTNEGGVEYAVCNELNTALYRLFILSLFWRCSITSQDPFKEFKLSNEEAIRILLNHSNSTDKNEVLQTQHQPTLFKIPIVVLRHKSGINGSGNFLYSSDEHAPIFQLQTAEYIHLLSLQYESTLDRFSFLNNLGNEDFKVCLLDDNSWFKLRDQLINLAAKKSNETAKEIGVEFRGIK